MRVPSQKIKRPVKVVKMKSVPKCKKSLTKPGEKDYISETISFVIKGKLTPIKPAATKKTAKKMPKLKGDNKQKPNCKTSFPKVQTKAANKKPTSATQKSVKKSTVNTSSLGVKKLNTPVSNKNETSVKKNKPVKKVKSQVGESKKKVVAVKKDKKSVLTEKQKTTKDITDDLKTKQTIAKLLKEANRALKQPQFKTKSAIKKAKKLSNKHKIADKKQVKKKEIVEVSPEIKEEIKDEIKTTPKQNKRKSEISPTRGDTSDDMTLNELQQIKSEIESAPKIKKQKIIKNEDTKKSVVKLQIKKIPPPKLVLKKHVLAKDKIKRQENQKARKMKLLGFWNGPKRHRVASLNALAKVHCLYENETRGHLLDHLDLPSSDKKKVLDKTTDEDEQDDVIPCTRTLRSVPGLRAVGKHWDMHDTTSSSEDNNSGCESTADDIKPKTKIKKESNKKTMKQEKRKRNKNELIMDLKDMVVRKRMASLNASAILAASYSVEKRAGKSLKSDSEVDSSDYFNTDNEEEDESLTFDGHQVKKEEDGKLIEVRATPNKKVAVILNQDTDVTITGVYVNSTTRSTHHEGYCSIAGMQYRISATSHTQTAATAVATETLLQSSSSSAQENVSGRTHRSLGAKDAVFPLSYKTQVTALVAYISFTECNFIRNAKH